MKNLSYKEYSQLAHNALILAEDEYGKKVLQLTDQTIVKLFRVKRLISTATFYSPARRFAKNAQKLANLSIPTVSLIRLYNIKSIKRTAVHYHQLEGVMVREYLQSIPYNQDFLINLGIFIAQLHVKGVFFRSAHFGNIIYTADKKFGLIDISDMKIQKFPLSKNKRLRNLKHIFRLAEDINLVKNSLLIEQSYLQHCDIKCTKFHQNFLNKCAQLKQI